MNGIRLDDDDDENKIDRTVIKIPPFDVFVETTTTTTTKTDDDDDDDSRSSSSCSIGEVSKKYFTENFDKSVCNYQTNVFDESIFVDALSFMSVDVIGVSNRADERLVRVHGKTPGTICASSHVALNPPSPCRGVNIHSMNSDCKPVYRTNSFNQITVTEDRSENCVPISLEHIGMNVVDNDDIEIVDNIPVLSRVFDVNTELTSFELAVIVKYLAVNFKITITRRLYYIVSALFVDSRSWFIVHGIENTVVQTFNQKLIMNNRILNVPYLLYSSGRPVEFN